MPEFADRLYVARSLFMLVLLQLAPTTGRAEDRTLQQREPSRARVLAEVPLVPDGGGVLVVARCFEREHILCLDTGCNAIVFDHSFREKLGRPLKSATGQTSFGTVSASMHRAPDISLGDIAFTGRGQAACVDLGPLREVAGLPIAGLVGIDALEKHVIELDLTGMKMRILTGVSAEIEQSSERLRMYHSQQGWCIHGELAATEPERFLIDTGAANSLSLLHATFDRLHAKGMIRNCREIDVGTLAGDATTCEGELQRFTVGRFEHDHLCADRSTITRLGLGYLKRYVAVFDFPGQHLYLRPSPAFNAPETPHDKSGLQIIRREKLTLVHECPPGSPASEAGLQKGDELLQLNGEAVEKLSLDALRSRLRQKGKTVEITAARGGVTFTRKITLCEYCKLIPPPSKD